ncbi:YIP1 family protein [Parabacteroides sp. FAFU027]|uniref:YIP1 family protein n=1 Tax=Parabacteroides sp. FAFU027 TaxID=2922715 RepID=UPI001FAFD6A2|nr:YIP1 family protein [Parabacteroides sp. FAFU027]
MIKNIFTSILLLITQPARAWDMLSKREESHQEYLSRFVYPLIITATIAAFLGKIYQAREDEGMQTAIKEATTVLTGLIGGFYLAAFALKQIAGRWYPTIKGDSRFFQKYVGYASCITFVIVAVLELIPDFFFIKVGELYVIYIIWESIGPFVKLDEKKRITFTAVFSALILLSPVIIEKILFSLMPGLKV